MAKDIKFMVGGNSEKAKAELRELKAVGRDVADDLARDFAKLGVKSAGAFDKKRQAARKAYDQILKDGKATSHELIRAEEAFAKKVTAINDEQFGKRSSLLQKFKANWIATAAVVATVGIAFNKLSSMVDLYVKQEQAIYQVEQRIKSTGGVAGFTSERLQKMASAFQNVTTYGDEAVLEMQALLLTFTQIRGGVFQDAQKAILNVATALGTDLKSAAIQVGKALNDPKGQLTALSRSGIQFTEVQKKTIKSMVEVGNVAGAQRVILKELEVQFGGSAEAARQGFGGALEALQNKLGDVGEAVIGFGVEGKTAVSGVDALTEALTGLEHVVKDTRTGIDKLLPGLKELSAGDILGSVAPAFGPAASLLQGLRLYSRLREAQNKILPSSVTIPAPPKPSGTELSGKEKASQMLRAVSAEQKITKQLLKTWKGYYGNLEALHSKAVASMEAKQAALIQSQKILLGMNRAIESSRNPDLKQNAFSSALGSRDTIEDKVKALDGMDTGKQLVALREISSLMNQLPKSVQINGMTVLSKEEMDFFKKGIAEKIEVSLNSAQKEVQKATNKVKTLGQEMVNTQTQTDIILEKLSTLDTRITALSRDVTLTLKDEATAGIDKIKQAIDEVKGKEIVFTMALAKVTSNAAPNAPMGTYSMGSWHTGTKYVPRTGVYQLAQGEQVLNRQEAKTATVARQGGTTVGDIHVHLPNITRANEKSGRELARGIYAEIKALDARHIRG